MRQVARVSQELIPAKGEALVHVDAVIAVADRTVYVTQILLVFLDGTDQIENDRDSIPIRKLFHT
jgi:hypothetical protein